MEKAENQTINCTVHDCRHCDCEKNCCELKEIKVCNCNNSEQKEATMCDNYQKKSNEN